MADSVQKQILVTGRVQGVGYRAATASQARTLNLQGWVRNLEDRVAVEICVEGSLRDVEALIEWCHKGPPAAKVASVRVTEGNREALGPFTIIR